MQQSIAAQLQEKSNHMIAQLQATERLVIAHFKPQSRERQEVQRALHSVWALCFLGYNSPESVEGLVHETPNSLDFPTPEPMSTVRSIKTAKKSKATKKKKKAATRK